MMNIKTISSKNVTLNLASALLLATVFNLSGSFDAHAGFDEKVAASFAAKYEVCSERLADKGMLIRAVKLKAKADEISRDKIGGGGYIEAMIKERKKAWLLPISKCKKFADKL